MTQETKKYAKKPETVKDVESLIFFARNGYTANVRDTAIATLKAVCDTHSYLIVFGESTDEDECNEDAMVSVFVDFETLGFSVAGHAYQRGYVATPVKIDYHLVAQDIAASKEEVEQKVANKQQPIVDSFNSFRDVCKANKIGVKSLIGLIGKANGTDYNISKIVTLMTDAKLDVKFVWECIFIALFRTEQDEAAHNLLTQYTSATITQTRKFNSGLSFPELRELAGRIS